MAWVIIEKMYKQNTLGDLTGITVQLVGHNRKGKAIFHKELTGKIGEPDRNDTGYRMDVGGKEVMSITTVVPPDATFVWRMA